MSILSWLVGLVGWGGALVAAVMVFFTVVEIKAKVWLILLAALAAWGVLGRIDADVQAGKAREAGTARDTAVQQRDTAIGERDRIRGDFEVYAARVAREAQAEKQAREQREGEDRERNQKLDVAAQQRAATDRADAERLLGGAVKLAARAAEDRRAIEAAAAAGDGAANARRARLYTEVFDSCRARYADMAAAAQRARGAGLECEARYDSAERMTGGAPAMEHAPDGPSTAEPPS